jgi:hypothetical protein
MATMLGVTNYSLALPFLFVLCDLLDICMFFFLHFVRIYTEKIFEFVQDSASFLMSRKKNKRLS